MTLKTDAQELLAQVAAELGLQPPLAGEGNGHTFNFYVGAGATPLYRVSIAIRKPVDGTAYVAIKRSTGGRNVIEDQVGLEHWTVAKQFFSAAVAMQRLGSDLTSSPVTGKGLDN